MVIGIVDDEPGLPSAIRRTLRFPLEDRGLAPEFLLEADPLDFLKRLANTRDEVRLVLSDTNMPNASGLDLIELLAHRIVGKSIPNHLEDGRFREAYDRIATDTVRQTRVILLSGDYHEVATEKPVFKRWTVEHFGRQHEQLLTSLRKFEADLPPKFFHTVLSKPYDTERLKQAVFEALGIA